MYLLLEDNDVVFIERVVALVRTDGETKIVMRDGALGTSCFTPLTLDRRSEKYWTGVIKGWKEQHNACQTKRG